MEGERQRAGGGEPVWPQGQAPSRLVHFSPLDTGSEAGVPDSWCPPPNPGTTGQKTPRRLSQGLQACEQWNPVGRARGAPRDPGEK